MLPGGALALFPTDQRYEMFGKTKTTDERSDDLTMEQFFGDEAAAEEAVRAEDLRDRLDSVESQLASQFTSLAAYAQIAQEQIETARAEAKHAAERAERRVIELIERERKDRIEAIGAGVPAAPTSGWTAPGVDDRLDALERSVAQIQHGLNECLARQKALADAITALFEPHAAAVAPATIEPTASLGDDVSAAVDLDATLPPPPAGPTLDSDSDSESISGLSIL